MTPGLPEPTLSEGYTTGKKTKREIIESAAEAFAQQGFHGASLRTIARSAGVDHSTLLHHFGSKANLLLAVLQWRDGDEIPYDLLPTLDATTLAEGMAQQARINQDSPGLVQLFSVLSAEAGTEGHPARPYLQKRHEFIVEALSGLIEQRRRTGEAPDNGFTPREAAAMAVSTWDGMQIYNALHPGEIDLPKLVDKLLRDLLGL